MFSCSYLHRASSFELLNQFICLGRLPSNEVSCPFLSNSIHVISSFPPLLFSRLCYSFPYVYLILCVCAFLPSTAHPTIAEFHRIPGRVSRLFFLSLYIGYPYTVILTIVLHFPPSFLLPPCVIQNLFYVVGPLSLPRLSCSLNSYEFQLKIVHD